MSLRFLILFMLLVFVSVAGASAALVAPTVQRDRTAIVGELLASFAPVTRAALLPGSEASFLIDELELLKFTPPIPSLLYFGQDGHWEQCAWGQPLDASADAQSLVDQAAQAVTILGVRQSIDGTEVRSVADFELVGEKLRGSLTTTARVEMTSRPDTCNFFVEGQALALPRLPKALQIDALMEALHAQLGPEMRGVEGVRLGMQTMYLDERLRITRCLTRDLAGAATVFVRRDDGSDEGGERREARD